MAAFTREEKLTLSQLAKQQSVHLSTVWRWALEGCRGVRLETFLVGGRRFTTTASADKFLRAINQTSGISQTPAPIPNTRDAAIASAEEELRKAGL